MRLITNEELLVVSGGIDTVIVRGKKMTEAEKEAYDQTPEGKQNAEDVKNGTNKT